MVELIGTFMALAGTALFCAAGIVHARWVSVLRMPTRREHRCWHCGYDLEGVEVDVCPECGRDRAFIEPLSERRRAVIAGWMAPAAVSCLFGLATTRSDMIGAVLLGTVLTAFSAATCRTIPMVVYFVALAVGLMFFALAGLAGRSGAGSGESLLWTIGAVMLFVAPPVSAIVYLARGRVHPDKPRGPPRGRRIN